MFRKILHGVVRVPEQPRLALRDQRLAAGLEVRLGREKRRGSNSFSTSPREKHWGFTSWNDYFTRRFKPGARPIADPTTTR